MPLTAEQVAAQKKQVEELLGNDSHLGFAKSLFFGRIRSELLFPYPTLPADEEAVAAKAKTEVQSFVNNSIDAVCHRPRSVDTRLRD